MRRMTIEELLMKEDDKDLLDVYNELESGIMPATGYAHEYIRKVNRLINEGRLCSAPGKYRTVYLPTVSKAVYKELARRYAMYCYNAKAQTFGSVRNGDADDEVCKCAWCGGDYEASDLRATDLGCLCDTCIAAIRSRGEDVAILE